MELVQSLRVAYSACGPPRGVQHSSADRSLPATNTSRITGIGNLQSMGLRPRTTEARAERAPHGVAARRQENRKGNGKVRHPVSEGSALPSRLLSGSNSGMGNANLSRS